MYRNINKKQAFTLIELLVVIAIIGILSGLIIVGMSSSVESANVAKLQIFSASLRDSLLINRVSEWKFDGNINDSWSSNNCTWYGSGTGSNTSINYRPASECIYNQCLNFDGTDDYIECGNGSNFNVKSIIVEMWLYMLSDPNCDGNNNWRSLIHKGGIAGTSSGFDVVLEEAKVFNWDIGTGVTNRWSPNISVPLNKWTHFVFVYEASSGKMEAYKDGVISSNSPHIITPSSILSNANNLMISNPSTACPIGNGAFPGNIDNVRIYNSPVPKAQIREHYYAGVNKLLAKQKITINEFSLMLEN